MSGLPCLPRVSQVSDLLHQIFFASEIFASDLIDDHLNFSAMPGVPLQDLIAGLSVAGLALVTILTVCIATVLLVRRWATGASEFDELFSF